MLPESLEARQYYLTINVKIYFNLERWRDNVCPEDLNPTLYTICITHRNKHSKKRK